MIQRFLFLALVCSFFITITFAQNGTGRLDGEWQFPGVDNEYVRVEGNNVTVYQKNKNGSWSALEEGNSGTTKRKKNSIVADNNVNVSIIETNGEKEGTITHTINMFYVSPYVALGHDMYYVNKIASSGFPEESWHWGDSSKSSYVNEMDVMVPRILKAFKLSSSMASTSPYIKLDEVFNTTKNTVLKFTISNKTEEKQSFTLHPPGNEKAFYITDLAGKNYKMLGEFGFGEYKTYAFDKDSKLSFYVFFERLPDATKSITIREGTCTQGCWNFYDVALN